MIDGFQEILYTLKQNKLRTGLTAFGVFWGIFMLVLLLGAGQGLQNGMTGSFSNDMSDSIWISAGRTALPYQGLPTNRRIQLTESDMRAIREQIPGVRFISSENAVGSFRQSDTLVTYQRRSGSFGVFGVADEYFDIKANVGFPGGRKLNPLDAHQSRKVVAIGTLVEQALFAPGVSAIGEAITINGVQFTVVGIFYDSGREGRMSERIYLPQSAYAAIFGGGERVSVVGVRPELGVDGFEVERRIRELLQRRHQVSPNDRRAIRTHNMALQAERFNAIFTGINAFLWFVGLGTLAAGIVGVSNIMIITVKERTREIGVRKALGATPSSIVGTLMLESILVTSIAGYTGLVLGVALLEGVSFSLEALNIQLSYFQQPEVDFQLALTALGLLVGVGALAGLVPAVQAARIMPVEAMRAD
ncbi:ABC transporter permease [Marinimicrobium sp. ABcell2]|uniref:ABC transporter permease n=1 Tax=Marinimicrobium sp. ABcell2 TaxID=3069751 RepID=UPI0027B664F0|nr:ABC transporter permease [Marinimicrobium sp. ABcell2]MDQ2078153.1 ABC transporter permease [Marinimicrobium sp. ABcell2]